MRASRRRADDVEPRGRFAMQPVGGPVRRDVAAVAPDRAELHAADGLPDLAALLDVGAGVDAAPSSVTTAVGNRRHHAVNLAADPQQHGERGQQQGARPSQSLRVVVMTHLHLTMAHRDRAAAAAP